MKPLSGQELVRALIAAGLSQTKIASIANVSQPTIARIASGDHKDPRSSTMDALRQLYSESQGAA